MASTNCGLTDEEDGHRQGIIARGELEICLQSRRLGIPDAGLDQL